MQFVIILIGIENSGNLGAIARLAYNFSIDKIILINPRCKINSESFQRAMKGKVFLEQSLFVSSIEECKNHVDFIIAFSGKSSNKRRLVRKSVSLKTIKNNLKNKTGIVGLLFGNERSGLLTKEIEKCDILGFIPTPGLSRVLNISHAVAIALYEITNFKYPEIDNESGLRLATQAEKQILSTFFNDIVKNSSIPEIYSHSMDAIFHSIIGRSFVTLKEINGFIRLFRTISETLDNKSKIN